MKALIQECLAAAGDMPDAAAHGRYLATLSEEELRARLEALRRDGSRGQWQRHGQSPHHEIRFWTRAVKLAVRPDWKQAALFEDGTATRASQPPCCGEAPRPHMEGTI